MYHRYESDISSSSLPRTRVDMLIRLYDDAVSAAKKLQENLLTEEDSFQSKIQLLKAINLIESGLDVEKNEQLPRLIKDICYFIELKLGNPTFEDAAAITRILSNLRDGYAEVRSDAISLEDAGQIPRMNCESSSVDTVA